MSTKVLVTPHLLQSNDGPHVEALQSGGFEIVYPPHGMNTLEKANIRALLQPDVRAIIASTEPFDRQVLAESSLRVVARLGVGYDSVDIAAATDLGIAVTITPGTLEDSVAEQTLALLLAISRDVIGRDREVRRGEWQRIPRPRLAGRTVGMVGLGRIGRAVVPRFQGLAMNVIGYDPGQSQQVFGDLGVERIEELEALIRRSDVVSLHAPCTAETEAMINAHSLQWFKDGAILLNTSRGGLIEEEDLCEALKSGRLFGAGLDVFREEPLNTESPLLKLPNVVTSTHVGGIDQDATQLAGRLAAQCIVDLSRGKWPEPCVVNQDLQTDWNW